MFNNTHDKLIVQIIHGVIETLISYAHLTQLVECWSYEPMVRSSILLVRIDHFCLMCIRKLVFSKLGLGKCEIY